MWVCTGWGVDMVSSWVARLKADTRNGSWEWGGRYGKPNLSLIVTSQY